MAVVGKVLLVDGVDDMRVGKVTIDWEQFEDVCAEDMQEYILDWIEELSTQYESLGGSDGLS
jgi:hypothetical protein